MGNIAYVECSIHYGKENDTYMSSKASRADKIEMDYIAIGSRIRIRRKQLCMTQADLGNAVGISTSFMGHIERGSRIPSIETLYHIATRLDVSVDGLLTGLEMLREPSANLTSKMRMLNDIMRVLNAYANEWLHG